jgi:hypothetical protein
MSHIGSTSVKHVNFIRVSVLNHRQVISLLEDDGAVYTDEPYHSAVLQLSLVKGMMRVVASHTETSTFVKVNVQDKMLLRLTNYLAFPVGIIKRLGPI